VTSWLRSRTRNLPNALLTVSWPSGGDDQTLGYLGVAETFRDERHHLSLAPRQLVELTRPG
jgi:hypothetical protein